MGVNDGESILATYELSREKLRKIMDIYKKEFQIGIEKGLPDATVAMLPSFLPELPDGTERGRYLGLDCGGTSLRVLLLQIAPDTPLQISSKTYTVPEEVMTGSGKNLFHFLASQLEGFLVEMGLIEEALSLGFVFSFPLEQTQLASAKLLWWTKGYNCPDTIGKDVVAMFQDAINERNLKVKVRAIMNDTVGTLAAAAYEHGPESLIGGVVSTGCNVSYMERSERITKLNTPYTYPKMVVDTEWEEFGNNGQFKIIETEIDRKINSESLHSGAQTQDQYTGGFFIGEHVRLLFLKTIENRGTENEEALLKALETKDCITAKHISEIIKRQRSGAQSVMNALGVPKCSGETADLLVKTCETVSKRSAGIIAAAICSLILHIGQEKGKVGLGGSVYQLHPTYRNLVDEWKKQLLPSDYNWECVLVEDGSGKGAALVAAIAEKLNLS